MAVDWDDGPSVVQEPLVDCMTASRLAYKNEADFLQDSDDLFGGDGGEDRCH